MGSVWGRGGEENESLALKRDVNLDMQLFSSVSLLFLIKFIQIHLCDKILFIWLLV